MKYKGYVVCRVVVPVIVEADTEEEADETINEAVESHDFCDVEVLEDYDTISVDRWMLENLAVASFTAEPYEEE